ncbi:MAG: adenosine deaminase, partial [Erysipelotrichaceae bacterium]|nr:adenosine deaminase [Erysipelotrichaceae bacterium]
EVCLTSNIQCRTEDTYASHPAKKLLDAGVKVTLNTDNMSIAGINLDYEYDKALEEAGFTYNDLITMNINSIECSFMPEEDKQAYIDKLKTFYQ